MQALDCFPKVLQSIALTSPKAMLKGGNAKLGFAKQNLANHGHPRRVASFIHLPKGASVTIMREARASKTKFLID